MANGNERLRQLLQQAQGRKTSGSPEITPITIAVPSKFSQRTGVSGEFVSPQRELVEKSTEDVLNARNAIDMVNGIFDFADETIPAQDTGREAVMSGMGRALKRTNVARLFGAGDEAARDFNLAKEAFGTMLARGLGERGVVTNRDVARVLSAFPREDDTTEGRQRRREFIINLLANRINRYNQLVQRLRQSRTNRRVFNNQGQLQSESQIVREQQ